jgi:hypothetical protein
MTENKTPVASAPLPQRAGVLPKPTGESAGGLYQGLSYNFGKVKVHRDDKRSTNPVSVQPKLAINQPGDIYEQEADAMAEQVMGMAGKASKPQHFSKPEASGLHRKCKHCEEEEKQMQRKEKSGAETVAGPGLESYVDNLPAGGQTLPGEVRSFFEPRFGHDFSQVKVHTDPLAAKSAQSINALAYTSGNNIVFGSGQYSPHTNGGKRLLGHELTHVVQQGSQSSRPNIQRQQPPQPTVLPCPGVVASSTYSRGNDDWAECSYETARMTVDLVLDPCSCSISGTNMPLSVNYSATLEGKSFTGRNIPNPAGTGTIPEQEGQASHIATGVVTPGRSRTGGTQPGMRLSEALPPGMPPNTSGPLALTRDDSLRGGRPGDPGDIVSQRLSLGGIPCIGGSMGGQVNLGGGFQVIDYSISASSTGVSQASIALSESVTMAGRIPTPLINVTSGGTPYPRFSAATPRPGGTGCTCNPVTGLQVGPRCNRAGGGAGFGRPANP